MKHSIFDFMNLASRKKLSDSLKAKYASGTRKPNPPGTHEKIGATLKQLYASGKLHRPVYSEELRKQIGKSVSIALKGRATRTKPWTKEQREAMTVRNKSIPKLCKGLAHCRARIWRVRSPENIVYEFKNLQLFIREHSELFLPGDVIWKGKNKLKCNANGGIQSICPRKKHPVGSWKNWTWYSHLERLKNEGCDLLERNVNAENRKKNDNGNQKNSEEETAEIEGDRTARDEGAGRRDNPHP